MFSYFKVQWEIETTVADPQNFLLSPSSVWSHLWRLKVGAPPVADTIVNHPVLLYTVLPSEDLTSKQKLKYIKSTTITAMRSLKVCCDVATSVIRRFRPSTSSSPGLNSPPGLLERSKVSDGGSHCCLMQETMNTNYSQFEESSAQLQK